MKVSQLSENTLDVIEISPDALRVMSGGIREEIQLGDDLWQVGRVLSILMASRGMRQQDLARKIGVTPMTISKLVKGDLSISNEMAASLQRALGPSSHFWLTLQKRSREAQP